MEKSHDFDFYKERYEMKEADLIAFIQGISLNFMIPGKFHIEIIPPNHGITVKYKDWQYIKSLIRERGLLTNANHEGFFEMIESRK